jgi:effector-binding domain-containing protein
VKKKIIFAALLLAILTSIFFPVSEQKTVSINASYFNVYSLLLTPANWENWRPDLKKIADNDSTKITIHKGKGAFSMRHSDLELNVRSAGEIFYIDDDFGKNGSSYSYVVVPSKDPGKTSVTVYKETSALRYLVGKLGQPSFAETHIDDLKHFLETDSLHYGFSISKTKISDDNLVEIKKEVLTKDKFEQASRSFSALQQYVQANNAKQIQPVIGQFLPKGKDSTQVNVGMYIDKVVKPGKDIIFVTMPKGGPLYSAKFRGRFNQRQKVYSGVQQYFNDHHYQTIILPFESYLDNKLPVSDTSVINIRVNFSAYF